MPRPIIIAVITAAVIGVSSNACTRERGSPEAAPIVASASEKGCTADAQCPQDFCDRSTCQVPLGVYGRACKPVPRTPEGPRDGKLNVCGAYLSLDGRCRSCQSDEQCRSELGAPRCSKLEGEPGFRCGNPSP